MRISVIIPAYNEEDVIAETIRKVRRKADSSTLKEVLVADGGSSDATAEQAKCAGAVVVKTPRGRAKQMNSGAGRASGEILYFLHADSVPPDEFDQAILKAVRAGHPAGCFQLEFDYNHVLLNFYSWFTRFDVDAFRFGDQSLFIKREVFSAINGFREDHMVMEDNDIVKRVKKAYSFHLLSGKVTTSARKYRKVGVLKLQIVFTLIYLGYVFGVTQETLVAWYKRFI